MPRQPRLDSPGLVHHVMARGIEGQDLFRSEMDRDGFLNRLLTGVKRSGGPQLYAWALMSNHFHLLLRSGEEGLASMMRRLMTGHAVSYNRRYKRQGHLFQNRYKSLVVEEETYLLELVRYIHLNPVRAGVIKSLKALANYPYTGHATLMGTRKFPEQNTAAVLRRFSSRRQIAKSAYERFVADGFHQGHRDELCGRGLIRSADGKRKLLPHGGEDQELWDERILGSGDFVAAVLQCQGAGEGKRGPSVEEVLKDVAAKSGVSREKILGESRIRKVSRARRQFYFEAHEKAGVTKTQLGRLTGRSHVAVMRAIDQVRAELNEQGG